MDFLLKGLKWQSEGRLISADLRIHQGKITQIGVALPARKKERTISLHDHYLYPGLINGHDHLEMNLYAHLGSPPYKNYVQWAKDVYKPKEPPVKEIESVPIKYRLQWGGLKNLISGVTTVVHHNPWHRMLAKSDFPVRVLRKYNWAHSLEFDKKAAEKFPSRATIPFVIHAAEGIDSLAAGEIAQLQQQKILKQNTVIVHGVGLTSTDKILLENVRASLVWCPSSNLYMFGQTTDVRSLKDLIRVCLGSDSTMTGSISLLQEMQIASRTNMASPYAVFDMVTSTSAGIFNLPTPEIREGANADLFVTPVSKSDYFENLLDQGSSGVSAVWVRGNLHLADAAVARELNVKLNSFRIGNIPKSISVDVAQLRKHISKKVSDSVLQDSPLWQMIRE